MKLFNYELFLSLSIHPNFTPPVFLFHCVPLHPLVLKHMCLIQIIAKVLQFSNWNTISESFINCKEYIILHSTKIRNCNINSTTFTLEAFLYMYCILYLYMLPLNITVWDHSCYVVILAIPACYPFNLYGYYWNKHDWKCKISVA